MSVKRFKNEKTGLVQSAAEGSRLHLLMDASPFFAEVDADGTAQVTTEAKGGGDGAGSGGRRRGTARKAADGRGGKQS